MPSLIFCWFITLVIFLRNLPKKKKARVKLASLVLFSKNVLHFLSTALPTFSFLPETRTSWGTTSRWTCPTRPAWPTRKREISLLEEQEVVQLRPACPRQTRPATAAEVSRALSGVEFVLFFKLIFCEWCPQDAQESRFDWSNFNVFNFHSLLFVQFFSRETFFQRK